MLLYSGKTSEKSQVEVMNLWGVSYQGENLSVNVAWEDWENNISWGNQPLRSVLSRWKRLSVIVVWEDMGNNIKWGLPVILVRQTKKTMQLQAKDSCEISYWGKSTSGAALNYDGLVWRYQPRKNSSPQLQSYRTLTLRFFELDS